MTELEFFEWLETCPTDEHEIVMNYGDMIAVNFNLKEQE